MENNRFDTAKLDILAISQRESTTFQIAALLWIKENGETDYIDELLAWYRYLVQLQLAGTLAEYFHDEAEDVTPAEEAENEDQ